MRILVLDQGCVSDGQPAPSSILASHAEVAVSQDFEALHRSCAAGSSSTDLLVLCDDDCMRAQRHFVALAATGGCPPCIVLGANITVDTAVALLKAGADDVINKDREGHWQEKLLESARTLEISSSAKQFNEQLAASARNGEQRLSEIIESSSVAMFVIDHEHRVTHWNRACATLTGLATTDIVGTREHWRAFYPAERPCMADLVLDGDIAERVTRYYGDKTLRPSPLITGSYEAEDFFPNFGDGGRWLFFTAAPLHDADGRTIGAIETLQDITEQKRAKEALRSSEQLLRQIIECSSVATFVINERHEVTHWNRACERLLGRSAHAAVGTQELAREIYGTARPILADLILDGADEAAIQKIYGSDCRRSALSDDNYEVEAYYPGLPGNGRWLHFAAAPLRDDNGRTIGAIETLLDITERKQAENRLQDSARLLSQIVDGSAVATFVIDSDHRVTHWNRACASLTGLASESLIGTRDQWRAFYAEARPCMADLVLDDAIEARASEFYRTKRFHRSPIVAGGYEAEDFFPGFGSSGRWLYFTAAPLLDAEGRTIGAIETLQDITEQKRAEEALRQSEERYRVLSITDGMTGLYNARHFALRLREEMDRFQRYHHPLALLVLDVDNFKQFNDTWGHVQGDQVLRRLAECMTHCLRRTDQAFRYGGEEFVALLPETGMDDAIAVAERIRSMFASTEPQQATGGSASGIPCSVSIGVTTYIAGESPNAFVARADSGTYEAKRKGKNCVVAVEPKIEGFQI